MKENSGESRNIKYQLWCGGKQSLFPFFVHISGSDSESNRKAKHIKRKAKTAMRFLLRAHVTPKFRFVALSAARATMVGVALGYAYANFQCWSESTCCTKYTAWCRNRLETPEYLIPYYLRSNLSRFTYFASKKEGGKYKRMDGEEFLRALLGQDKMKDLRNPKAGADLFEQFDTNGDGEISFREFSFMLTLLATPRSHVLSAFQMFNSTNSSATVLMSGADPLKANLTFGEFCDFIETEGDEFCRPKIKNKLMAKLFGSHGEKRCSAEAMLAEVDAFKTKVWRAEFLQYVSEEDFKNTKTDADLAVSAEAIGSLVCNSLVGMHLPFNLVANLRKLKQYDESESSVKVPIRSWYTFSRLMENIEPIGAAVRLYTHTTGRELGRSQFARAVSCSGDPNLKLNDQELDLLFALFDSDGSGTISFEELEKLSQTRRSFHVKSRIEQKGETREHFLPRLLKCSSESLLSSE